METLLLNLLILLFFFLFMTPTLPTYIRPNPGPLVFRPHNGLDSDPQQVHISLAGKDHMRVSWITLEMVYMEFSSIVEYGKTSGKYDNIATGESTSYCAFCYNSGQIHHVKIGPLEPNMTYHYRCGRNGQEFRFRTPPSAFPVEFAVVGDLGQTNWTVSTLDHVGAKDYDVFLLPGDLSYANYNQTLWDSFGRLVEPYASTRPWMTTTGNHDVEAIPVVDPIGFRSYNARWQMPYNESQSNSNLYYSFDVAGVHIIMLGSYTNFSVGSDQYKWLQSDLKSVDRTETPWVFVLMHVPWYNSNTAHIGEGESMRVAMEEVLYNATVDVVFAGHVHAYERFTRVHDNKTNKCGPVYVTIGDGGNKEGLAKTFENPSPPISVYHEASFGHGRLRVFNATHAHWMWHSNNKTNSVTADGTWLESLISKPSCKKLTISSKPPYDEL